jgi:putative Holliday junction resolvase
MRVLGLDIGRRRIGVAISDPSGTLARPLVTLTVDGDNAVDRVATQIDALAREDDGIAQIVIGLPLQLDGAPNAQTAYVLAFIEGLKARTDLPIATEGERLTSHEAEQRLALREKDWRKRKARLDAAAAAIILQDYLDRRPAS